MRAIACLRVRCDVQSGARTITRTIANAVGLPRTARPPKCANGMNEAVSVLDGMRRLPSFRVGMVYGANDRTRTAYP
jgi:hypothetical protein